MTIEKLSRRFHRLVEPDLVRKKRMGGVLDDSETGRDTELRHLLSELIGTCAGIIVLSRDKPAGRIRLVEVNQR